MSDSGMHTHAGLNRELRVTSLDGSHDHEFRLPDGSTVRTSVDGGHAHTIDMEGMHFVHGGVHAHRVVVDGVELQTEVDGWHGHEIGENKVSEGGMHSHALVLPTGETVISLHVDTDTEQAKRKKGANRKREPVTEKHLDAVTTSAKAAGTTDLWRGLGRMR